MPKTVLLIDDSNVIRSILKVYLVNIGLEFVEAETAERGLQLVRLMPVDLVIADVRMPGMDGVSFVRTVRGAEEAPLRNVPIVLLTSDKSETLRSEGLAAGANAFVHKPVSAEALQNTVRTCLGELG